MHEKRIVRLDELCRMINKTAREIHALAEVGDFPRPRRRGHKVMGWDYDQVCAWIASGRRA